MTEDLDPSAVSSNSPMPKRPMAIGTMPIPSRSSFSPKVKRGTPRTGSMPIIASSRPRTAEISARTTDRLARVVASDSPISIRLKNSGGPNFSATAVSGSASRTSPMVATLPPTNEPMAAMASAEPARPFLAMA